MLALVAASIQFDFDPQNVKLNAVLNDKRQFVTVFDNFVTRFNKYYFHNNEYNERQRIFRENLEMINSKNDEKDANFALSLNGFSDLTWEEFEKIYLLKNDVTAELANFKTRGDGKIVKFRDYYNKRYAKFPSDNSYTYDTTTSKDSSSLFNQFPSVSQNARTLNERHRRRYRFFSGRRLQTTSDRTKASQLNAKVDWKNYATVVQDQGSCASCYAFSSLAAYETLYSITYRKQLNLSEQEIIECSTKNAGCTGGNPFLVYDYINKSGISLESDYPYTGVVKKCKTMTKSKKITNTFDYYFLDSNIFDLLQALAYGPVVVIHHVNNNFKQYMKGVFDDKTCSGELNHSSLAVGYDLTAAVPYILCKNAWANDWGEAGFYRISIGALTSTNKGTCGIVSHDINVAPYFDN